MGEVYRASDTRLGREAAIKVLPESFARDSARVARFQREARLLAVLNHPNIGAIYGLEEHGSINYLVLELVPGETLAKTLRSRPLPISEALAVCRQVAEALEAAHEKEIVHRDLKPANIMIRPDGKVTLLDFGLAKGLESESASPIESRAPTLGLEPTHAGMILGTAAYMSPEQARGQRLDARTDIWSLGCVLYESLTGRKAFEVATLSGTVAAILDRQPNWQFLPPDTPERARWLLRRCLEKDLRNRLRHIGDARIELEDASVPSVAGDVSAVALRGVSRRTFIATTAAGLLVGGAGAELFDHYRQRSPVSAGRVVRFSLPLPPGQQLVPRMVPMLAISPDAKRVAFCPGFGGQIYSRPLNGLEAKPIPGTRGDCPFFSPDGRWLGFRDPVARTVKKVAVGGGAPVTILEGGWVAGAAWDQDDYIYLSASYPGAISRIRPAGGRLEDITKLDTPKDIHRLVDLLPGGEALVFTVGGGGMDLTTTLVSWSARSKTAGGKR
jgi:serine/threonine-protein kinase